MSIFFEVIFPVVALIAIGNGAARLGRLGEAGVKTLSDVTFLIFMPALLFGALARVDFNALSPTVAMTYYGAGLPLFLGVLILQRRRGVLVDVAVVQALCAVFSNTAMLGIPLVRLAFGEEGLAFLLTIIALHALIFLTLGTLLIELPRGAAGGSLVRRLLQVMRSSLIHPVVLPILAGLAWSAAGYSLPRALEVPIGMLGAAATPLCLVLLGASLAQFDVRRGLRAAMALTGLKGLVHPLLAWSIGRFVFELPPLPLAVATITAALPIGANVYLFAQRYGSGAGQASAGIALSTLLATFSLPWLLYLLAGR
jgi:malonate transporter